MARGRKKKWEEDDLVYVEKCLEEDSRTYNAAQLARKLATERKVVLSQDRLRKILKARGWVWKRTIYGSSVCVMQWTGVIRDGTLIEKGI
jgi:transposase